MYKSIYYDKRENVIHIWDDIDGYKKESFDLYSYGYKVVKSDTVIKSLYGENVKKIYPHRYGRNIVENEELYESDVNHEVRYIIDNYKSETPSTNVNVLFYDIETEMVDKKIDVINTPNCITSIAVYYSETKYECVYILKNDINLIINNSNKNVLFFDTEKELLLKFLDDYELNQPQIITGWNIDNFDNPYLYSRIKNILGRLTASRLSPINIVKMSNDNLLSIAGVSSLDYMWLYQKYESKKHSSYSLDNISKIELGSGKINYSGNLDDLYKNDINKFIEYNLNDIKLVIEMDKKLNYIELTRMVCHLCRVPYDSIKYSSR
jgi:DNA polymerase elongation subunit (family B)